MEELKRIPEAISYEALLRLVNERCLESIDQYRRVYIIQLAQRLKILISQEQRRLPRPG